MSEIHSPLTKNTNVSFERNIKSKDIIKKYKQYQIDVSNYFKGLSQISIYKCNDTGYRFYYPLNLAGDSAFYQHFQNFDWYYMPWKWEHEATTQYLKDGLNVLEVGCAHGAFLNKISELYDLNETIGLELNESSPVENSKWKIVNQYVQEFQINNKDRFDIVCSYQVLEHISDVNSFIEANVACLKQGGKLIISVPNNDSHIKLVDAPLNLPPHHMGLWTKKSLEALSTIFPLKLIDMHFEKLMDYHLEGYIAAHHYSAGNILLNKTRRKIDKLSGKYQKLRNKIITEQDTIIGHTIMAVFEKI